MTAEANPDEPAGLRVGRPPVFGRPGGRTRFVLGVAALITLLVVTVTVARLDLRLGALVSLNQDSLDGARRIAAADDRLTRRLHQLNDFAGSTRRTLERTRALQPLLTELRDAIEPAATAVTTGRAGGERTAEQLADIQNILLRLKTSTQHLAASAAVFDRQGTDLLHILDGLLDDVRASLEAAQRIDAVLPLPRVGGR